MCRDTISVGWDGRLFDCDFNQQLDIGMDSVRLADHSKTMSVFELSSLDDVNDLKVKIDNHCFGCTAGSGSGCQGATM